GDDIRAGVHASKLAAWGTAPPVGFPAPARLLTAIVALYNIVAFAGFMTQLLPARAFLLGIAAALITGFALRRPTYAVIASIDLAAND
ncbi:hypothetical protein, partial [Escherichia coli]|uniref:hypothetical protein n=1 Tax=Escherichia coli TaxID=562 RepID=UPI003CE48ED1